MRLNIGSIGICTPIHGEGVVSPDYVVFRCDEASLNPLYFHYHLKTRQWSHWVTGQGEGSVRERIYFRKLAEYEFDLPTLSYQNRIVDILSSLDDRIELNRRINETLEAMARAVFKDWFVDFGPTRAKAKGRAPYLAPELWICSPTASTKRTSRSGGGKTPSEHCLTYQLVERLHARNNSTLCHAVVEEHGCQSERWGTFRLSPLPRQKT